jgi:glycosyltransferase involved in cell wall biosynthesis
VGSVCIPLVAAERPPTGELFGVISDELKTALLRVADVALNPMLRGSGTNMKMLDYMAAGVPVISTAVGARGLGLDLKTDLRVAELDDFCRAVRATLEEPGEVSDARASATRDKVASRFNWQAVSAPVLAALGRQKPDDNQVSDRRSAISA